MPRVPFPVEEVNWGVPLLLQLLTPRAKSMLQFISALLMAPVFRAPVPLTHREAHVACGWLKWTQLYERPSLLPVWVLSWVHSY